MNSLGIKEFASEFPLVAGGDLLDFDLDDDKIGGGDEKDSFSDNFSGGGGGGLVKPEEQEEEELEWLRYFPEVEDNIIFDKPEDIGGFLEDQHSPVSVLENNSGTNNDTSCGTYPTTTLKVPAGFPDFIRKKRIVRKRRADILKYGQQHRNLFMAGLKTNPTVLKIVSKNNRGGKGGTVRRCLHCGSDTTPQWRTGPLGKKTLCNACGVRYKSGRLVPEYRPANSPTFMPVLHSNSHKKIMQMRRMKEEGWIGGGGGPMFLTNGTFLG